MRKNLIGMLQIDSIQALTPNLPTIPTPIPTDPLKEKIKGTKIPSQTRKTLHITHELT